MRNCEAESSVGELYSTFVCSESDLILLVRIISRRLMVDKGGYSKEARYEGLWLEYYVDLEEVILSMRSMIGLEQKAIWQAEVFLSRCGEP